MKIIPKCVRSGAFALLTTSSERAKYQKLDSEQKQLLASKAPQTSSFLMRFLPCFQPAKSIPDDWQKRLIAITAEQEKISSSARKRGWGAALGLTAVVAGGIAFLYHKIVTKTPPLSFYNKCINEFQQVVTCQEPLTTSTAQNLHSDTIGTY